MTAYRVWCPDRGEEEFGGADVQAGSVREAACEWAETKAGFHGDPFDYINCHVRESGTSKVYEVGVEVEVVPSFYACIGDVSEVAEPREEDTP